MITASQIADYRRDGYLLIPDFVSVADREAMRQRARELVVEGVPEDGDDLVRSYRPRMSDSNWLLGSGDKIQCFLDLNAVDDSGRLRQDKLLSMANVGHALHDLDPVFDRFSRSAAVEELMTDLGYQEPLLIQGLFNFKQPFIGSNFHIHQDGAYIYTEPMTLVSLHFALEDATLDNGCLQVLKGHLGTLWGRFKRPTEGRPFFDVMDRSPWSKDKLTPLEVSAGTCIVLHPMLLHMSGPNRSARSRNSYVLSLYEGSSRWADDNWLRRNGLPLRGFR